MLGVEPQEVVPGQAEPADVWHRADTAMRPVPIVAVKPPRQLSGTIG